MKLSEYLNEHYPLYTNHTSKRKIRHDFFKNIDTELHAYLLGLIMSDGSIDDKRATLSHTVNEKDKEFLNYYRFICPLAYVQDNKSHCFLRRKFNKFNYYVNTEVSQIITDHCNALEVNVNESNNPPKSVEHLNSTEKDENVR